MSPAGTGSTTRSDELPLAATPAGGEPSPGGPVEPPSWCRPPGPKPSPIGSVGIGGIVRTGVGTGVGLGVGRGVALAFAGAFGFGLGVAFEPPPDEPLDFVEPHLSAKITVHIFLPVGPLYAPTPMTSQRLLRMFERWPGDCMNELWTTPVAMSSG